MARFLFALACSALTLLQCQAQDKSPLEEILSFEKGGAAGGSPVGWNGGPAGTIFADDKVVHGGRWSARIERVSNSASTFSALTTFIPVDFTGKSIELRGFLRLEDVSDFAGLWMREDGPTPALAFDNMQRRQVNGTRDWAEYSITLPLHQQATKVFFGVLETGTGKTWADDLQLLVDGKQIWEAPRAEKP